MCVCSFRSVDPFDLWLWLELYRPPSHSDLEMLQVGAAAAAAAAAVAAAAAPGETGALAWASPPRSLCKGGMPVGLGLHNAYCKVKC